MIIRPGIRELFRLALRRRPARPDVDREIEFHVAMRAEQLQRDGMSTEDARHEAIRRFEGDHYDRRSLERTATLRDTRMNVRELFDGLVTDIRYVARTIRREPLVAGFIVITFALGIGANAAMFGVADRLLLRGPEHVRNANQVTRFYWTVSLPKREVTSSTLGYVTYELLRPASSFSNVGAYVSSGVATFGRGETARQVPMGGATATFFPLLGVSPAIGRFFNTDEDLPSGGARVVVLSFGMWREKFGSDTSVLGTDILLDDEQYTVIGVAPRGFTGAELARVDVWTPMSTFSARHSGAGWQTAWNSQWLRIVGRLKPGVTREQASADLTAMFRRGYGGGDKVEAAARFTATPLAFDEGGREPAEVSVSRWLVGVALVVLIIACTNVLNLLLARAARRRREIAVRLALGVGRARLARLLLTESMTLALLGGAVGIGVAYAAGYLVRTALLPQIDWTTPPVDSRVLIASVVIATLLGAIVGLATSARAGGVGVAAALKAGARDGGARLSGTRTVLTVVQGALSVLLLIGAGLFVRSLLLARSVDLGIDPRAVVVTELQWPRLPANATPDARQAERARRLGVYTQLLESMRGSSDMEHASLSIGLPFQYQFSQRLRVDGWDKLPETGAGSPRISAVASDYFATVGTPVIRGRAFTPSDRAGSELVALVSQRMAQTLWPNGDPIGACLYTGAEPAPCSRIVGIVGDVHRGSLRERPGMNYYVPFGQERGIGGTVLVTRPRGAATASIAAVREAAQRADPSIIYAASDVLQSSIDPEIRPWRLGATVFAMLGVLALMVASVGMYSVVSYFVAQRRQEIGVRLALGATAASVVRVVLFGALRLALIGVGIGAALALAAGRFIQPLLFDTSARDPIVFGIVTIMLIFVTVIASLVPALRVRGINPVEALLSD